MWRKVTGIATAVVMLVVPVAHAAGPSFFSAEDNMAFAVSMICLPFVFDGQSQDSLPTHRDLVARDGWQQPPFDRLDLTVRVGVAGFVHVGVADRGGRRTCEITGQGADPQALRKAAIAMLAGRPEQFAAMKSRYLPGRFETEDMLCAAPDGAHPAGFIFLSSPHREERDRIAIELTISDGGLRSAGCDREKVPMNYRTLAP